MFKFLTVFAFTFATLMSVALPVLAGPSAGVAVEQIFSDHALTGSTWVPLVTSSVRGISGVSIFSSAAAPIVVGVAYANDAAQSEVTQMIVPPALSSVGAPGAVFYPLALGYGTRISIKAASTATTINAGEIDMSLFYN